MARVLGCGSGTDRGAAIGTVASALRRGNVAVAPDEAMYTMVADAFSEPGVDTLRRVKGAGSQALSILVGRAATVDGVAAIIPRYARDLMSAFWPGPMTLLLRQQPSLVWPLRAPGVAVRMPLHPVLLELVMAVGPTAATAANIAGLDPVMSASDCDDQFGDDVDWFLDAGQLRPGPRSSVVDCTGEHPVLRRDGAFAVERIADVCPELIVPG